MDSLTRQLERGVFNLYVLWACRNREICGSDLLKSELEHGHELSMGRLYPALKNLCEAGFLKTERRKEHGNIHKYYSTTPEGKKKLEKVKQDLGLPMRQFLVDWLMLARVQNKGKPEPQEILLQHHL